jgi:hypothetical protein
MKNPIPRIALALVLVSSAAQARMGLPDAAAAPDAASQCSLVNPCGDVNASGSVTSGDALLVLKKAVGQGVTVQCPVTGSGAAAGIIKTGQTTCFDSDGNAAGCAGTRQDGELQTGLARSFTDNGDGTITDNTTSLMWEKLSLDTSVHDESVSYTWDDAFGKIVSLNSASFAGHVDWRLPSISELESLKNFGASDPAVYPVFNSDCAVSCTVLTCSCGQANFYWSSTTNLGSTLEKWGVLFNAGVTSSIPKTYSYYVRAVRSGS